jgi:hypothetical protein
MQAQNATASKPQSRFWKTSCIRDQGERRLQPLSASRRAQTCSILNQKRAMTPEIGRIIWRPRLFPPRAGTMNRTAAVEQFTPVIWTA